VGKMTIEDMQKIAKSRGGRCLSTKYAEAHKKLLWECSQGHSWEATPSSIKNRKSWCPVCSNNNKLTIADMNRTAEIKGGKCLSETYINSKTKLLWECSKGHRWEAAPADIRQGKWCPVCGGRTLLTIDEMRSLAKNRGGKCLSEKYVNVHTHLLWECAEGHQWEAIPLSVKSKRSWCPVCAGSAPLSIKEMRSIAMDRGGKCLSDTYVNSATKLLWECADGHQWEAPPSQVKSGAWCLICSGSANYTIEDLRKTAENRGGRCLSDAYENVRSKLRWECAEGHTWEATLGNILNGGHWCPFCSSRAPVTIENMRKVAEDRGGKCLSGNVASAKDGLVWKCADGHQWKATPDSIKRGTWCPECSSGLGERICRILFEQVFKKPFIKSYPGWLVNDSGNRMELDGFCESLGVAFEHHGRQHFEQVDFFHKSKKSLDQRKKDDEKKRSLCAENGVHLIEIPELFSLLKIDDLLGFVADELEAKGVPLPEGIREMDLDFNSAYKVSSIDEMRSLAKDRGGNCLSEAYVNSQIHLFWECAENHQWEAVPNSVKSGSWCPVCARKNQSESRRLTIEEMRIIAKKRGGNCLSEMYVNSQAHLLWECAEGHQWQAVPGSVKRGSWCPVCDNISRRKKHTNALQ